MGNLGERKKKFLFSSAGVQPDPQQMLLTVLAVIKAAGMTVARSCRVDDYPYKGGGGHGYTLFQPLTESYVLTKTLLSTPQEIIIDAYPRVNETELLLSTCKPERINVAEIVQILERDLGPTTLEGTIPA